MGIKLDWQIESERTQMRATEDPELARRRQMARRRLVFLILGLAVLLAAGVAAIYWRLDQVEQQYRQDLVDTVEIEVAALRLGDFASFMSIQRSASDAFMLDQSRLFQEYQELKRTNNVELPGTVRDTAIDNLRGRVVVEEVIDGVPYHVAWFYWYYEDGGPNNQRGWRHVPADLTFWGDEAEIVSGPARVTYRTLDQALAEALAPRVGEWWARGCELLGCLTPPPDLRVDIVAERPARLEWAAHDGWTLRITSPLVERARADMPLPPDLSRAVAEQIAARLVRHTADNATPAAYSDAQWLTQELTRWLADQFTADSEAENAAGGVVASLVAAYGPGAPGALARATATPATLDAMLSVVTGQPLALLPAETLNALDWRPFFQWRLDVERRLLDQADGGPALLELYDLESTVAVGEVSRRIEDPTYAPRTTLEVRSVTIQPGDNASQIYAFADVARPELGGQEQIIWRLAGGTWKRAN